MGKVIIVIHNLLPMSRNSSKLKICPGASLQCLLYSSPQLIRSHIFNICVSYHGGWKLHCPSNGIQLWPRMSQVPACFIVNNYNNTYSNHCQKLPVKRRISFYKGWLNKMFTMNILVKTVVIKDKNAYICSMSMR